MNTRLEKIMASYKDAVQDKLEDTCSFDVFFKACMASDPDQRKKSVRWILDTYLNDGFLVEDVISGETSKVYETLTFFYKFNRFLQSVDRSLMKYKTLGNLWNSIKSYIAQDSGNRKEDRMKAYEECDAISPSDLNIKGLEKWKNMVVVSPRTEFAARWFGKGTRWCTSAQKDSYFDNYNKLAPLYIFMMSDGPKFQLWVHNGRIHFMDSADNKFSMENAKEYWLSFKELFFQLYLSNAKMMHSFNSDIVELFSESECRQLWKYNKSNIMPFLNSIKFTEDEIIQGLREDVSFFKKMDDKYKTDKVCNYVIYKMKDLEQCAYVPESFFTPELVDYIFSSPYYMDACVNMSHSKHMTKEILDRLVLQMKNDPKTYKGTCLYKFKKDMITPELFEVFYEYDKGNIAMVDKKILKPHHYVYGIQSDIFNPVHDIPGNAWTDEMVIAALEKNTNYLTYIPEYAITYNVVHAFSQLPYTKNDKPLGLRALDSYHIDYMSFIESRVPVFPVDLIHETMLENYNPLNTFHRCDESDVKLINMIPECMLTFQVCCNLYRNGYDINLFPVLIQHEIKALSGNGVMGKDNKPKRTKNLHQELSSTSTPFPDFYVS